MMAKLLVAGFNWNPCLFSGRAFVPLFFVKVIVVEGFQLHSSGSGWSATLLWRIDLRRLKSNFIVVLLNLIVVFFLVRVESIVARKLEKIYRIDLFSKTGYRSYRYMFQWMLRNSCRKKSSFSCRFYVSSLTKQCNRLLKVSHKSWSLWNCSYGDVMPRCCEQWNDDTGLDL